jgi:beta-lactamase regulating signal transducer with metallopeptidase domain
MMLTAAAAQSSVLLSQLVTPAVRTVVLAGGAGLLLAVFRVKAPAARLFIWIAVLYAGLSMPILGYLLHPIAIAVPVRAPQPTAKSIFLSKETPASAQYSFPEKTGDGGGAKRDVPISPVPNSTWPANSQPGIPARWVSLTSSIQWSTFALVAYLGVTLVFVFRIIVGLAVARRLVRSSTRITDSRVISRLLSPARGARKLPLAHESQRVSVPLTVGVLAPSILLPLSWREWDDTKLDAVIAHEVSHVLRWDPLSQCVALVYRAVFWFSPLAWWLNRHIVQLAEEASDEAALTAGTERGSYARTLLGFFQAVQDGPGRVQWQGVAMASARQAEKRLEKILAWTGEKPMRLKGSAIMGTLLIAVIYVTAATRPLIHTVSAQVQESAQQQVSPPPAEHESEAAPPQAAPASPSAPPAPPDGGVSNSEPPPTQPVSPASPSMPVTPSPPISPETPSDQRSNNVYRQGFSYAYGYDDDQRFVIVSGKSDAFTMSGTGEDARHVENLKKRIPGDFIWFQRDEKSYIIRDQATVDRALQLWAPQQELGRKQAELGRQQEALGKQQEALGARMQQVRVKVPDMTAELDRLKTELKQLGPDTTVEQIGKLQAEIGELQAKVGQLQGHAGDEHGKLGAEMGALGEQQGKLGEQQGKLGRQQADLAQKATRAMKELLDDAIKRGIAQPEPQEPGSASL